MLWVGVVYGFQLLGLTRGFLQVWWVCCTAADLEELRGVFFAPSVLLFMPGFLSSSRLRGRGVVHTDISRCPLTVDHLFKR
ncbi:hypothetical protein B0J18DRAFT_423536 [Chaetomium sp. MPI-SDFR-AT-0129]|nr:hypothetical protein B0J18DRAFT_423536 [Chaetomium sp. MPI-SDFR-AT-0129]